MQKLKSYLPVVLVALAMALAFDSYIKNKKALHLTTYNGERIQEKYAEKPILKVAEKITIAERNKTYSLSEAFENETILHYYILRVTFNNDNPAYGISYESAPPMWWKAWSTLDTSQGLRKLYLTPKENAEFELLKNSTSYARKAWNWESKQVLRHEDYWPMYHRLIICSALIALAVFLKLMQSGGNIRNLIPPAALRFLGLVVTFGLTIISLPALSIAQVIKRTKKDANAELKIDSFGDFKYDRQQIISVVSPITPRLNLVLLNQNREAANGASKFSLAALGLSFRPLSFLTVTGVTGPQQEFEKGRVDQHTTFLNAAVRTKSLNGVFINRFSRGLDGKTVNAHRHIFAIGAGPMPTWLKLQTEIRRSQGKTTELFLGPTVQPFSKSKNSWLKGLYVYPFWDQVKRQFDVRIGFTRTFEFN